MVNPINNLKQVGKTLKNFLRKPVHRSLEWRYAPAKQTAIENSQDAQQIIERFHHPGYVNWKKMIPYPGAVYSIIRKIDRPILQKAYPKNFAEGIPAVFKRQVSWSSQIVKTTASVGAIVVPLTLESMGVPAALRSAFLYLSLNAARNVASDLIAKFGVRPLRWLENLDHIKWGKLTDSLVVTAFAFPLLMTAKTSLHQLFEGTTTEWLMTPLVITLLDGAVQLSTRKVRGFNTTVGKWDMLRPAAGDLGAISLFRILGLGIGNSFNYLLARKVFSEIWSGLVEGKDKRQEKVGKRNRNLANLLRLDQYKVPDPEAMAAINLVYWISHKSVARRIFTKVIRSGKIEGKDITAELTKIHRALEDDKRINRAMQFLFPSEEESSYLEAMRKQFRSDRHAYRIFLKQYFLKHSADMTLANFKHTLPRSSDLRSL